MSSPSAPSLQRRLALELSAALGLLLILLFLGLDLLIDRELYARLDASLRSRANAIAAFLESRPDRHNLATLRQLMPEYELPEHTDFFEVWDARGQTLFRSASSAGRSLARPPAADGGDTRFYDTLLPDGHAGRAIALRVMANLDGRPTPVTLVVATERESIDRLERRIHTLLMAGVALALLLALAIAQLAVRRGLAPVLRYGESVAAHDGEATPGGFPPSELPKELQPFDAALRSAFDRLYATIERERRFSRDVAHELRTPLAEIRTSIETAMRQPQDRVAADAAFTASVSAVERMQRAIDALLLLVRYESGQAQPALDPLDLGELLRCLEHALQAPAARRELRFENEIPPGIWVRSDAGALERILSNLLRNAVDYAPARSTVRLAIERRDGELWLCIRNCAPGLSEVDLANFGRRFWRKSPAGGTSAHAGLGLALAIALARSLSLRLEFALEQGWLVARLGGLPAL